MEANIERIRKLYEEYCGVIEERHFTPFFEAAYAEEKSLARTNYVRGREVEYKCVAQLKKDGFRCMRASSSKGDFDVIGYNDKQIRFIQLKREKERQGSYPSVREEIRKLKLPRNKIVTRELWTWTDHQGWLIQIIGKTDVDDQRTDLRRKRKANTRGSNRASTKRKKRRKRKTKAS